MHKTRNVSDFRTVQILALLYIHNELAKEGTQIHLFFRYTLYTQPEDNFPKLFLVFLQFDWNPLHEVRCGIFHSWHRTNPQKVSDFGTFQISGFGIRHVQPVPDISDAISRKIKYSLFLM